MIIIFDNQGVTHAVYNQREVREQHKKWGYVENWQVRTLCSPTEQLEVLQSFIKQADLDLSERGHTITCIRCATGECDHGVTYDPTYGRMMLNYEVRERYPRLDGECPRGCGYKGIAYASYEHYVAGDW